MVEEGQNCGQLPGRYAADDEARYETRTTTPRELAPGSI